MVGVTPTYSAVKSKTYGGRRALTLNLITPWGALLCGPGGPWPTQNFGRVGHNAFGPTNIWSRNVTSLV